MLCSPAASAAPSASDSGADKQAVGAGRMTAQVDDRHLRQRPGRRPLGERQTHEPAARDVLRALQRRRGRAEDRQRAGVLRAHHRQIAPVVADALLLLERGIVLLVDDHHAERPHRREDRRARAERDADLAGAETPPGRQALLRRQPAVQHRHVLAEARPKPRRQLRRERDLGHQHQGALPGRARGRDDLQVDLRLPGAGHAVQEKAGEPTPERGAERGHRRGLRRVQREDGRRDRGRRRRLCLPDGPVLDPRQPRHRQRPQVRPLGGGQRCDRQALHAGRRDLGQGRTADRGPLGEPLVPVAPGRDRQRRRRQRPPALDLVAHLDQARFGQPRQRSARPGDQSEEAGKRKLAAGVRQRAQDRVARSVRHQGSLPTERPPAELGQPDRALGARLLPLRQRRAQHLAERSLVVVGGPPAEGDHRARQRPARPPPPPRCRAARCPHRAPAERARRRTPSRSACRTAPPPARRPPPRRGADRGR